MDRVYVEGVDIASLIKAFNQFEKFRVNLDTEQAKAGTILAFGCVFELCWKTMQRILYHKGLTEYGLKPIFRAAALGGMIHDPKCWFEFLEKRMLVLQVYPEVFTDDVIKIFPEFSKEVASFLQNIMKD